MKRIRRLFKTHNKKGEDNGKIKSENSLLVFCEESENGLFEQIALALNSNHGLKIQGKLLSEILINSAI